MNNRLAKQLIKSSSSDNPIDITAIRTGITKRDLLDPGDERFRRPILRVGIQSGVAVDNRSDLYGPLPAKRESGVKDVPKVHSTKAITEEQKAEIVRLRAEGKTHAQIVEKTGLSRNTVYRYLNKLSGPESVDKSPETVDAQPVLREIPPASVDDLTADECFRGLTVLSLPERDPEPPPPTIDQLREGWSEVHQHDQTQAAVAAKILRFLDGIKEEFKDEPGLANKVAHQGVAALEERYRQVQEKRRLEAAS